MGMSSLTGDPKKTIALGMSMLVMVVRMRVRMAKLRKVAGAAGRLPA